MKIKLQVYKNTYAKCKSIRKFKFRKLIVLLLVVFSLFFPHQQAYSIINTSVKRDNLTVYVTDFFPENFVTDGSVSYQKEIQAALSAVDSSQVSALVFPPMVYLVDETGLRISSNITLWMYGAIFKLDKNRRKDGKVFYAQNVSNINFFGGEIMGENASWKEGVNIRGIYITGQSQNILIKDMYIHNLSSNGIGVFGETDNTSQKIEVTNVIIENCCNTYGDYLSKRVGPEPGSDRSDQGLITFYHVQDFVVRNCEFEKSRSDGTHFYMCQQGQFVNNKVYSSKMGGYFIEGCKDIIASGNIIKDNGSRGVTIERGSKRCTLINNVVSNSGREGLWAPNCKGLVITDNIFDRNGRKPNGEKEKQIWNANITVSEDIDPTNTSNKDYIIANNIIYTTEGQYAAILIDVDNANTSNIIIKNNLLCGKNKQILIRGKASKSIILQGNE